MRVLIENNEIVLRMSDGDIAELLSLHEFQDGTDTPYLAAVDALFSDFKCWPVSTRNKVILKLLKQHIIKDKYKEIEAILSVGSELFN